MSEPKKGIDISWCQTQVDWNKVDVDFPIVQIGGGYVANKKAAMFESHYAGAKSRGIPVGGYWFTHAVNEAQARQEADTCIELMRGKQFEYPIYLDLEKDAQYKLGKTKVSAIIRAWLERVEAAGYWVGLYSNLSFLYGVTDDDIEDRYAIWLAQWDVAKPTYNRSYGLWQYSVGQAAGVTGACDLDYGYVDYPAQIKAKGLNGYGKQPEPEKKTKYVELAIDGATYAGTLTEK
jgi:GH25 family lysozyme M1 (1,4-beta-N-acetylmuramidase)